MRYASTGMRELHAAMHEILSAPKPQIDLLMSVYAEMDRGNRNFLGLEMTEANCTYTLVKQGWMPSSHPMDRSHR